MKLLALIACAACAEHVEVHRDAPDPVPPFPATLELAATSASVSNTFAFSASGSAEAPFGAIAFERDVGTLGVASATLPAFAYSTVDESPYTLYDGFAVDGTSWHAFYAYCNPDLVELYDEVVAGDGLSGLVAVTASGSCTGTTTATVAPVALPAIQATAPERARGFTVTGDALTVLGDGNGSITLSGTVMPLAVFDIVDCRTCGGAGWYELHSVIWDGAQRRAIFVIAYLLLDTTNMVELAYARSLPDLVDPIGTMMIPAQWSSPTDRPAPSRQHGVRPPPAIPRD